jgi:RNA polymerase sigma-70 factor (ECF subfamily)
MTPSLATFTDRTLVELTLAGQVECFSVLMGRHAAAVKHRLRSMVRNAADADDMLQEVLLQVWRHLATFRSESSFRTWMTRVAINQALQSYRREQRRPVFQLGLDLDIFASLGESPYREAGRNEVEELVRGAVRGLPPKLREVLILRDIEELSTEETSRRLHLSVPAVKMRLFRARLLLTTALQRLGIRGSW